ncbi:hypothetical protein BDF22DRAFT_742133 [Syncephalis plumigaleata]|nr:hypothetical protein BDF22DRAFT_742133 [Syncephalis plumigaleata]
MTIRDKFKGVARRLRQTVRPGRSRRRARAPRRTPIDATLATLEGSGDQSSSSPPSASPYRRMPYRVDSRYSAMSADVHSILRSRPVGRPGARSANTRRVYVNLPAPRGAAAQHGVVTNRIKTTKYTVWNFLPKNLFEQFRRAANVYFLFMAALQIVPYFNVSSVPLVLFPICFVLAVTALKDGFEDWKRYQQDHSLNRAPTSTLQRWRNVNFERDEDEEPVGWRAYPQRFLRFIRWPWFKRSVQGTAAPSRSHSLAPSVDTNIRTAPHERHTLSLDDQPTVGLLRRTSTYDPSLAAFQPAIWQDIRVGDVVFLRDNDSIPADLVVLATSEPDGECYIETKNLDGETNLKTRRCTPETAHLTDALACAYARFYVENEAPSSNLYVYRGTLRMARSDAAITREIMTDIANNTPDEEDEDENDDYDTPETDDDSTDTEAQVKQRARQFLAENFKSTQLDINNTLLRGSVLRNTGWVIAVAVFTGAETKIMLNAGATPSKRSRIEKLMNRQVIINFILLLLLCSGCAIGYAIYYRDWTEDGTIGVFGVDEGSNGRAAILNFLSALIVFQNIIPISLYISVEVVKTFHAFWIFSDIRMYDSEQDQPCVPKTWNISDDLGQVEYVFSDKTGTLTRNVMEFRKCSIRGRPYGERTVNRETDAARGARLREHSKETSDDEPNDEPSNETEDAVKEKIKLQFLNEMRSVFQPRYATVDPDKLTFADPRLFVDLRGNDLDEYANNRTASVYTRRLSEGSETLLRPPAMQSHMSLTMALDDGEISPPEGGDSDIESLADGAISVKSSMLRQRPRFLGHGGMSGSPQGSFDRSAMDSQPSLLISGIQPTTRSEGIREFYMLLGLCHTVIVERPDEEKHEDEDVDEDGGSMAPTSNGLSSRPLAPQPTERILYRAESPDEDALVSAARDVGFTFLGRRRNELFIDVLGRMFTFELLNVLPFDSTRKRMSVIVRRPAPWNDIVLYCKGADNVILERLASNQDDIINQTSDHLDSYSRDGLRVLLLAYKEISEEEYADWQKGYHVASTSINNRDALLNACAEEIETNLTLIGATAIEDRLQENVPQVIASLRHAGMKVWVLTGDKLETAINIGYSCSLLTQEMHLWTIRGDKSARQTIDEFIRVARQVIAEEGTDLLHPTREQALVIDGQALKEVLDDTRARRYLLSMSTRCRSVICCRVSPLQKAQVVHLIRKGRHAITLAIGDGANDVSMIQTANIGVAIAGKEGLQASMSSDYTIAQFQYLKTLLLVHGQWSYLRVAEMILNFFYKNVLYALTVFFYQIYCAFSANIFVDYTYVQLYNLVFTVAPVVVLGCCDQAVNAPRALAYPGLYRLGINQKRYSTARFWVYILEAMAHAAIIYFVFYAIYSNDPPMERGFSGGQYDFSSSVITTVVIMAALFVGFNTYAWNWIMCAAIGISIVIPIVYLPILSSISSSPLYGAANAVYGQANFWFALPLAILLAILPRYLITFIKQYLFPEDVDIVREMQKYHLDGIKPQKHFGADSAFEEQPDEAVSTLHNHNVHQQQGATAPPPPLYPVPMVEITRYDSNDAAITATDPGTSQQHKRNGKQPEYDDSQHLGDITLLDDTDGHSFDGAVIYTHRHQHQ